MQDLLFSLKQYQAIMKRLDGIIDNVTSIRLKSNSDGDIIDSHDLSILLHVSLRTLQRWRNSGKLPYSKISRKNYYKIDAVLAFCKVQGLPVFENEHPPPIVLDSVDGGQVITCQRCPLFEIFNSFND